jgi:hypothetical protein
MQARLLMRVSALIVTGAAFQSAGLAQTAKAPPKATPEWSQTVTKESTPGGREFDAKQQELICGDGLFQPDG